MNKVAKNILEVQNLTVCYGEFKAISDINFSLQRGDFVGLTGPNGSGKSTLIKAILGLVKFSQGEIALWGKAINQFSEFSRIGYVPQKQTMLNPLLPATIEEVLLTGLLSTKKIPRLINKKDRQKVAHVLATLKITLPKDKIFTKLSGGQQQKILLARALITQPELLILDEPSSALDQTAREDFFQLLRKINSQDKVSIILISHDTGSIGQHANKILYIDQKQIFFGALNDFCPEKNPATCFEKRGKHLIWHQHD
ncbi:MAG TPA: metal ABC transporter ATP-binding protein [Candidatus Moranbacteria bacterium]|nr:metal ABC transporter ATP-binding protein [Candidatus Moranbacteria bacterium]